MLITRLELQNWKNFAKVDVKLSPRVFIVGNNGAGKSNLMDALRFLRDIANPQGGGLQTALDKRGGLKRTRCLFARKNSKVRVCVEVSDESSSVEVSDKKQSSANIWRYDIVIKQDLRSKRRVLVESEKVSRNNKLVLDRPDKKDKEDSERLTQTALEQVGGNKGFRELAEFFQLFKYLHTVPQLIRHASEIQGKTLADDPFGQGLINSIAAVPAGMQKSRLRRIGKILEKVKPDFQNQEINFKIDGDKHGKRHLMFKYPSWTSPDSWQTEEILSDGELRLIGLLWTLLSSHPVVLLEEPELSFNEGIVARLPSLFVDAMESKKKGRVTQQVIMSTHSHALLMDTGITAEEILLLLPEAEKTIVTKADERKGIACDMRAGLSASQSVLRFVQNRDIGSLLQ